MGSSSSLRREVFLCSFSYMSSSHFFSVRYSFDHSSLQRELIDICCYLRGFNASVACLVFFSIDSSLTVVVNVRALSGPFSPCFCLFQLTVALPWWLTFGLCLDHLVLVVVWFCFVSVTNVQIECSGLCSTLHSCGECSVQLRFLAWYDPACP